MFTELPCLLDLKSKCPGYKWGTLSSTSKRLEVIIFYLNQRRHFSCVNPLINLIVYNSLNDWDDENVEDNEDEEVRMDDSEEDGGKDDTKTVDEGMTAVKDNSVNYESSQHHEG